MSVSRVKVYCCGGTGTNIGRAIRDLDIEVVFVDTSMSNLKGVEPDRTFLVEGMDGAGKFRDDTYANFKDVSGDVLLRHKPSDVLNIVVSSVSGGSGSVIGNMLTPKLLSEGRNTVVIGVESNTSVRELKNAIKSLNSYRGAADKTGKPVSLFYIQNEGRSDADARALHLITLLTLLVDKKSTVEFDNSDLKSFLFYDRVTDNPASVAMLEVCPNEEVVAVKGTAIVGSILMTNNTSSTIQPELPEYLSTCVVTEKAHKGPDIRINSVLGKFALIVEQLEATLKGLEERKHLNRVRDVQVSGDADGMDI